jgi:hypothetical protein
MGRNQIQALATVRGTECQLLGDHAPHRNSDDVRTVPSKVVEDPNRVIGHRRNRPKERPAIALTDAEMVVVAAAVVALELVDLRPPNRPGHTEPHDEEHRRTLRTEDLIRQPRPRLCKVLGH